jgi:hypothetical protein
MLNIVIEIVKFRYLDTGKVIFDFIIIGVTILLVICRCIYIWLSGEKYTKVFLFMAIILALFFYQLYW